MDVKQKHPFGPQPFSINEQLARMQRELVKDIMGKTTSAERAVELACQAYTWADHLIARFEAENPLPHPIVCQPGCHFCCYNQIELTPPEVLTICGYLRKFPADEQQHVLENVERSITKRKGKTKRDVARMRSELPCPLLRQGFCAVYPVRPLLCRAMHSLDVNHCQASLEAEDLIPDRYYLHRYEIVFSIILGLTDGCQDAGCQANPVDLAQAVQILFQKPEDVRARWLQGEKIF
jgi:Fe-S-cluster containining protein